MNEAPIILDTETCGLHGMPVLIQWAEGDGPIELFSPWTQPIRKTLELIEKIANHPDGIIGFNLSFDWFMLCKIYTVFSAYHDHDAIPEQIIDELAYLEPGARDGKCLKPVKACDLMLHARKGPYQSTMDRGDIRIRRVPTALAWQLADELERRIKLKDIYFAKRKDKKAVKWNVLDITDSEGEMDKNFKDIVLKFAPSSALKALAVDALNLPFDSVLLFTDIEVDSKWYPEEHGFAPFALAIGDRHNWKGAWPEKIRHHISHWNYHETARIYAAKDVDYTRDLYKHFGSPELGDTDSELACLVAAVRWKGFSVNIPKLRELRIKALKKIQNIPTAPAQVRIYINQCLDETEKLVVGGSTKKIILEELAKLTQPCPHCNSAATTEFVNQEVVDDEANETKIVLETLIPKGKEDCTLCFGKGCVPHAAAVRAKDVLDARASTKEIELFDKIILAGRFHASFKVIGALSSRMSGDSGLNAQGVKKTKEVRSCFPLAWDGTILNGGDFAGFEVTIAEAVYGDANLRTKLLTCEACEHRMDFVKGPTYVSDYLGNDTTPYANYCASRKKEEAKKAKKDSTYVAKTIEEIEDEQLESDFICPDCGSKDAKKIHALFGLHCYPEHTYESLKATSGTANDQYTRAKSGVFALMYGGTEHTLADRLGVAVDIGIKALASFHREFPGVRRFQEDIFNKHCTMRQPNGIGSKVEWHEPADYRETMFGFRRYFTLENEICRQLFTLANSPPKTWRDIKIRVMRRDRVQTASGAVQSSLYGSAFQIQAGCMRAAANHDIQSAGATMTKAVQKGIWDLQPPGIGDWIVQCMNVHDEIMCVTHPDYSLKVKERVNEVVESFREKIPLIKMDWITGLQTWADKS